MLTSDGVVLCFHAKFFSYVYRFFLAIPCIELDRIDMVDIKKNDNLYRAPENSLLESILFLMTPEQKEYFLRSSASKGMIYANKTPSFDNHFSVFLTPTAYNGLCDLLNQNHIDVQNETDPTDNSAQSKIEILKNDLEAGIRLYSSLADQSKNSDKKEEINIRIYSRLFFMSCYLQIEQDDRALLRATFIGSSQQTNRNNSNDAVINDNINLYDLSDSEELTDTDILDASKVTQKKLDTKSKPFFPHIKTTWHIYKSYTTDAKCFDLRAVENLICDISNNLRLSVIHYDRRRHLKELADTVKLSQLAMQYRYEINDITETSEDICSYELAIDDPIGDITKIKCAYVYEQDEDGTDYSNIENDCRRIEKLLRHRLKKPAIIENKGYQNGCYLFDSLTGKQIPAVGLIADVGLESKIRKESDAIRCIATSNTSNHLIKLGTLLGDIKTDKLEPFNLSGNHFELFDDLLSSNQKEAVTNALTTPDIYLIQGPPGTGKTRVISEIIRQTSKKDLKTLLVAPTHVAVDNVLEKIGFEDNISAIRCVNKDKLQELDKHIQQFTYDQRRESVINHSRMRAKKDIDRLELERSRLETLSKTLKDLCSKYNIAAELEEKLKRFQFVLSSTEEAVRQKFREKLKSNKNKINCTKNFLSESKKHLEESTQCLKEAIEHSKKLKSESYNNKELKRIEQAILEDERIHGKTLRKLQETLKRTQKNIQTLNQEIRCEKTKLQNTKATLSQINEGRIPENIRDNIVNMVNSAASKCDKDTASKTRKLKYVQTKLQENGHNNVLLEKQIEQIRQKQDKLAQNRLKCRWFKPFEIIWWQSLFNDYDFVQSDYTDQLQNSLKLIPALKLKINEATVALEKSKVAKKTILQSAKKTEFIRQCNLCRSFYNDQIKQLKSLNEQLQKDNSAVLSLNNEINSAESELDNILSVTEKTVQNDLRGELALKIKNVRDNIITCEKDMKSAYKISLEAHIEGVKLEYEVIKAIVSELDQLQLRIDTAKTNIRENSEQVDNLKKQAECLLENKPPKKVNAIEKIIGEINTELERNEELLDFSQRWMEYLLRDSGLLSKHLSKYINLACATTVGIASDEYFGDGGSLEQKRFDILIVDEAGKVTEPEFLVAATRAKRWVIVGDHKQLPPYYDRKLNKIFTGVNKLRKNKGMPSLNPEPLQISYFENLWNKLCLDKTDPDKSQSRFIQLDVQRRMHPDLALFISDMFYDGQYNSPEEPEFIKKKTLKLSRFDHAVTFIEVCPSKKQRCFEMNLCSGFAKKKLNLTQKTGYANLKEAQKVIEVLTSILMEDSIYAEQRELEKENDSAAAIGIMAFYAGQVELIRRLIKEDKFLEARELSGNGQFICKESVTVVVNSVDSFQGKECSVIILSFTRSNPYQNIGFVDDANRLNVAMSRARKKLVLIGDSNTFTRRAHTDDHKIKGNDSGSIRAERLFFEKLVEHIESRGEIKKVFQLLEDKK